MFAGGEAREAPAPTYRARENVFPLQSRYGFSSGAIARAAGGRIDVRRVVDDDVEVDLHPEAVGAVDERAEVRVGAEVRVDGVKSRPQ